MTGAERDELLAAYLAGKIEPADKERLIRELRSDPAFARSSRDLWVMDKLLSFELDTRARRAFVEIVSEKVGEIARAKPADAGPKAEERDLQTDPPPS
jgi:hypothetical protein